MAVYNFSPVPAWGQAGSFARIGAKKSTTFPCTLPGGGSATVVQGGTTKVGYVESDANGLIPAFTTTDIPSVDINFGVAVLRVNSAEAITSGASSAAAAASSATDAANSASAAASSASDAAATVSGKVSKDSLVMLASDHGVVGDGTADDGAALNTLLTTAASAGKTVQLAPGSTVRSTTAITPPSGTRLDLNGSTIKSAMPGVNDRILPISGVSNVRIWNGTIDGDKASFAPTTEQRHNVHIVNSSKVTLRDLVSKNAKGDGIYIGDDVSGMSSDVVLDRVTTDANWRQGLSVVAVDGLFGFACRFINTAGTAPQSGMDVEPNTDTATVRRIKMVACEFKGNATQGLIISTRATPSAGVVQDGGEYVGCNFDQNTTDGVYLNNARNVTFTGGTVKGNGGMGMYCTTATGSYAEDITLTGTRIESNGGKGFYVAQPFNRLAFIGVSCLNNTGIGLDLSPTAASVGLRIIGCTSGNRSGSTSQTHGYRTGTNVSNYTGVGNVLIGNATAATSLADDVTTRFLMDQSNRLTVTGSRGGNAALAALLTGLAQRGLVTDSTTA